MRSAGPIKEGRGPGLLCHGLCNLGRKRGTGIHVDSLDRDERAHVNRAETWMFSCVHPHVDATNRFNAQQGRCFCNGLRIPASVMTVLL